MPDFEQHTAKIGLSQQAQQDVQPAREVTKVVKNQRKLSRIAPGLPLSNEDLKLKVSGCTLLSVLGRGGMGVVYLARQTNLDRYVAVKMLNSKYMDDHEFVTRLTEEARIMGAMSHPNVVGCHDVIRNKSGVFIIMEYIPGRLTVKDLIMRFGPLPERYVVRIMRQVLHGLAFVYEKGFLHKDLKPDNLLVFWDSHQPPRSLEDVLEDPNFRVCICDFGISARKQDLRTKLTDFGNPDFIAPEQITAPEKVDCRADMYALGATSYFLLTGAVPFGEFEDPQERLRQKIALDCPLDAMPMPKGKVLSDGFKRILRKLLAVDPDERFDSYAAFRDRLERLYQFQQTRTSRLWGLLGQHLLNWLLASVIGLLIAVCIGMFCFTQYWRSQIAPSDESFCSSLHFWQNSPNGTWQLFPDATANNIPTLLGKRGLGDMSLNTYFLPRQILHGDFRFLGLGSTTLSVVDVSGTSLFKIVVSRNDSNFVHLQVFAERREIYVPSPIPLKTAEWLIISWEIQEQKIILRLNGEATCIGHLDHKLGTWTFRVDNIDLGTLQIRRLMLHSLKSLY